MRLNTYTLGQILRANRKLICNSVWKLVVISLRSNLYCIKTIFILLRILKRGAKAIEQMVALLGRAIRINVNNAQIKNKQGLVVGIITSQPRLYITNY